MPKRFFHRQALANWRQFWKTATPAPEQQAARLRFVERNVGLPVKVVFIGVLFYFLFFSNWFEDMTVPREDALQSVKFFFLIYVVVNVGTAILLIGAAEVPLKWLQRVVFMMAILDGLFLAALAMVTGGFDSLLYWVFLGLIVRNAVSIPEALPQIIVNLLVSFCYVLAGFLDKLISEAEAELLKSITHFGTTEILQEDYAEPFLLRLILLLLMTACCYGVQVLFDKQRQVEEEAREFALRQQQLQATGRLAAEIAHQLKNPLGIINNAAFTLQRTVKEGKATITQQIKIIREEVDRSDRIITELMGYAQLAEGKVERLIVTEELDRAVEQVFTPAVKYDIQFHRDYASALPPLLVQRSHLSEVFVNLLHNAREAMNGSGHIALSARYGDDYSVIVTVSDDGPGIPAAQLEKIFEPYFTTKEKGTGLGLAIVKHNVEIYGGTVRVESELGKGTRFILQFPARTMMKLRK